MNSLFIYAARRDTSQEPQKAGAESSSVKQKQKHVALILGAIVMVIVLSIIFVCVVTYLRQRRRSRDSRLRLRPNFAFAPLDDESTFSPRSHDRNSTILNTSEKQHDCRFSPGGPFGIWAKLSNNNSRNNNGSFSRPALAQLTTQNPISTSGCASQPRHTTVSQQPWPGTMQKDRQRSMRHITPILHYHPRALNFSTAPTTNTSSSFIKIGAINPLQAHPNSPVETRPPTPPPKSPLHVVTFDETLPLTPSSEFPIAQATNPYSRPVLQRNRSKDRIHRIENPIPSPSLDLPPGFGFENMSFPSQLPRRMSSKKSCQSGSIIAESSIIPLPERTSSNSALSGAPPLQMSASVLSRWRKRRDVVDIPPPLPARVVRPDSCTLGNFVGCGYDYDCHFE